MLVFLKVFYNNGNPKILALLFIHNSTTLKLNCSLLAVFYLKKYIYIFLINYGFHYYFINEIKLINN